MRVTAKNILCPLLFFLLPVLTRAQLEADNWAFSAMANVNFNRASFPDTVNYPGGFGASAGGTSSYSDRNGKLLFLVNASYVYNKYYRPFPSVNCGPGTVLNGVTTASLGFTQPNITVPYPGHDSLYIIFHIYCTFPNGYASPLYYSVINMNLDGGLGDIVPGQKNIPLLGGQELSFKLTAVQHCNKRDIWIIGHYLNSDKYFSLLVTSAGVSTTPNIFTGEFIPNMSVGNNSIDQNNFGCMKVSALGNKLAAAHTGVNFTELMDFNTSTGLGSNVKMIVTIPPAQDTVLDPYSASLRFYGPIGVDFSPSGKYLYINSRYNSRLNGNTALDAYLFQFDAMLPTEALVQSSQSYIDVVEDQLPGAIQIGNNGKMYINVSDMLAEITDPELPGALCGYRGVVVPETGASFPNTNLPVFLQSYFKYPLIATGNCQFQNISFSIQNPVGVSAVTWDFGDPASGVNNISNSFTPTHIFSAQGTYTVKAILQNANGCASDTIRKVVYAGQYKVFLGNDTSFCQGDTLLLRMNIPGAANVWSTGSRDTMIKVTGPGTYWVKAALGDCVASDTIIIAMRSLPQFTLGNDTAICGNQQHTLQPQPAFASAGYLWNTNAATSSIIAAAPGLYWLQVTDQYGCRSRDSINISFQTLPSFNLGNDTALCQGQSRILRANVTATNYLWNTGESTQQIAATTTGWYWCDATLNGCTYRDSIRIQLKPIPVVQLGADTTICEDQIYMLNASNPSASYQWQDGSVLSSYTVTGPGTYFVKVTMNGCSLSDTINISYDKKPVVNLGPDLAYCPGMQILINPGTQYAQSFLWQDGSSSRVYTAAQEGLYHLTVTNDCGSRSDSVLITKGVCKVYVPGAFTPNNDGVNDLFKIQYGEGISSFEMNIFNRWGQRVFFSTDKNKGWDGRTGNKILSGAYSWTIKFKESTNNTNMFMKGIVLLIK